MRALLYLLLLVSVAVFAAPPTPSADCGSGATVVGSRDAGKVTIGASPDGNICTLTGFSWPGGKVPSCSAMLESGNDAGGFPLVPNPYATVSTGTTLTIVYPPSASDDMRPGNVISYLCVGQ